MKKNLKVLELFSGIRALSVALDKLNINYDTVDSVEIDKYAIISQNAMFNTNFKPQDIRDWDKKEDIDLLMHGSPCQDFSIAGKQAGGDEGSGTRSSLLYETIRIVETNKPKIVIWENVKNVLAAKHKKIFDDYLNKMEEIGYTNYYEVLNSRDFDIPQSRERVFTVSIRKDLNKEFKFPIGKMTSLTLKDVLEDNVDESFFLSEEKIKRIAGWKAYQKPFERVLGNKSISPTLTARGAGEDHSGMIIYSNKLENNTNLQNEIINKPICLNSKNSPGGIGKQPSLQDRIYDENGIFVTLTTSFIPKVAVREEEEKTIVGSTQEHAAINKDGISPTLTSSMGVGGGHVPMHNYDELGIRKLTPLECWRLMGFPDSYYNKAKDAGVSKTQLYKQAGNSIVVNVLEAILKSLFFNK